MSTPAKSNGDGVAQPVEYVLAGTDQTSADTDQTLSDTDQTSSDRDQTSSESDQWAADRDQAASDRDRASGVDSREYEYTRHLRERTTLQREQASQARLDAAHARDEIAYTRDLAARARDQAADARDLAMAQHDTVNERADGTRALDGAAIVVRAAGQRKRAAKQRARAAEGRVQAAEDRRRAARDREQAAAERLRALVDREALAQQLALASMDMLTGARARAAGLTELDHELERCRRTGAPLVLVYVDVVGLRGLNDSLGHAAGDELLKRLVTLMREHLRPYDLVIRHGGDRFLCAMSDTTLADARLRFGAIAETLAAATTSGDIRTGFAELAPDDTAAELIARANSELVATRHG